MFRTKSQRSLLFISAALLILIADQVSKASVRAHMLLGESIPDQGKFRLTYSTNKGGVFGLDINSTLLTIVACIVVVAILWVYFNYLYGKGKLIQLSFGLVLGGAIGNVIDRFRLGKVTDFIDVRLWGTYHWPTFNIADAALSTGIIILIFCLLLILPGEQQRSAGAPPEPKDR